MTYFNPGAQACQNCGPCAGVNGQWCESTKKELRLTFLARFHHWAERVAACRHSFSGGAKHNFGLIF